MSDDNRKKISFGFSKKSSLPPSIGRTKDVEKNKEFIESLEGKQIKTFGVKEETKKELVIPLKQSIPKWQRKLLKQNEEKNIGQDSSELKQKTLEELAAQELINDAKTAMLEKEKESKVHSIPLAEEDEEEEDKEEPTLDDYTKVPVSDFGLAMLRGMGWSPGKGMGKNPKVVTVKEPTIRPRGMGLGAELTKPPTKTEGQEDLPLCKGAFIKIVQGPLVGLYGQVDSVDDSCGRVILHRQQGGQTESVSHKNGVGEDVKYSPSNKSSHGKHHNKPYGLVKKHRSRSPDHRKH
ncbi:hypothetical protein B566_EDAN001151 [Ephemera danica]|nr:hypothetical protein B566_EDAN001151 [Ephemera danica]